MSENIKNSSNEFATLKTTWIKQSRYNLSTNKNNVSREKFGAFSISASVRGSCNKCHQNPWYRDFPGVC